MGDGAIIENCEITGSHEGIKIDNSSNHVIRNNTITECQIGITNTNPSSNNIIEDNRVNNCIVSAMELWSIQQSQIKNNQIENATNGIIVNGANNSVSGNTIQNCCLGLSFENRSSSNQSYQNNFINNSLRFLPSFSSSTGQAFGGPESNQWDDGSHGNYWSDYSERYPGAKEHSLHNGIWDTPYEIPGSGGPRLDRYPNGAVHFDWRRGHRKYKYPK